MKPSLVDVGCKLTAATIFAQEYILLHPEHEQALTQFMTRVNHLRKELFNSFYGKESLIQEEPNGQTGTNR